MCEVISGKLNHTSIYSPICYNKQDTTSILFFKRRFKRYNIIKCT